MGRAPDSPGRTAAEEVDVEQRTLSDGGSTLGVSSVSQLDECLGTLDLDLDDELQHRLDAA